LYCMALAIELAKKGLRKVKSNPMVGCVIGKNKKIIGTGYHKEFGGGHAEILALLEAGKNAKGATMLVSLEPCNHIGKTPPCTDAIIRAGVKRVVVAARDPNPVAFGGIKKLKEKGIEIEIGLLEKQATELNRDFFKLVKTGVPFVSLKIAMTLNEKISWGNGRRKKITGAKADAVVQRMRAAHDAILVGINTVLKDNPRLTARAKGAINPTRIVVDSRLHFPFNARMLKEDGETIVFCTKRAKKSKIKGLEKKGVKIIAAKEKNKKIDLKWLLKKLAGLGIKNVLCEGGAAINESLLKEKLVDEVAFFIAPKLGKNGLDAFGKEHEKIMGNLRLKEIQTESLGKDILVIGKIS